MYKRFINLLIVAFTVLVITSCSEDSGKKEKEEELPINYIMLEIFLNDITFEPVQMFYVDPDGDGDFEIDISDWGVDLLELNTGTINRFQFAFFAFKDGDTYKSVFIEEAMEDHIVCFEVTNDVIHSPEFPEYDFDSNDLRTGLSTRWTTSSTTNKTGSLKMTLRHQPGTKTGDCPGEGIVDFEIVVPIKTYTFP